MVPVSVLLVEDNEDILANLYAYLEPLGYELDCARNGRTGLEMAASGQFDLVVLDIMLPGLDGISLCRALREEHGVQVPVIMLTARDTVADRVLGLDAGADDYLVKPFALRELEARIRALLRRGRTQESAQGGELRVDDVCIDVAGHRVTRQGREVKVSPTGFRILCELARRAPALVRREELERRRHKRGSCSWPPCKCSARRTSCPRSCQVLRCACRKAWLRRPHSLSLLHSQSCMSGS